MTSKLIAIAVALIMITSLKMVRADEIQPTAGDCDHPINAPIDGQLPSTVTWCPDSMDNPVTKPNLG